VRRESAGSNRRCRVGVITYEPPRGLHRMSLAELVTGPCLAVGDQKLAETSRLDGCYVIKTVLPGLVADIPLNHLPRSRGVVHDQRV
jgi:hypothetical protein